MSDIWKEVGLWLLPYLDYVKPAAALVGLLGVALLALQKKNNEEKLKRLNETVDCLLAEDDEEQEEAGA